MSNNIFSMDLTRTLPPVLRNDPKMQALSQIIAEELQETAGSIKNNIIYASINTLPEKLLDVLAYDLHVDWYDYNYPAEVKRELLKTSVRVHKKLGTVYAVETALGALHPRCEVEEWFQYDGNPYCFRINIYLNYSRLIPGIKDIIRVVAIYKRLTAHLEKIVYKYHSDPKVRTVAYCGMGVILKVKAKTKQAIVSAARYNSATAMRYSNMVYVRRS